MISDVISDNRGTLAAFIGTLPKDADSDALLILVQLNQLMLKLDAPPNVEPLIEAAKIHNVTQSLQATHDGIKEYLEADTFDNEAWGDSLPQLKTVQSDIKAWIDKHGIEYAHDHT